MNYELTHPLLNEEQTAWLNDYIFKQLHLRLVDCPVVTISGSNLYGLARGESDIDLKAVYLPPFGELLMGNAPHCNVKKDDLNIEIEVIPISDFLKSCAKCDTNMIDILHAPEEMLLHYDDCWVDITSARGCLYSKNMVGMIGYIKKQAGKYSNKIDRYNEASDLLTYVEAVTSEKPDQLLVGDIYTNYVKDHDYKFINLAEDDVNLYIEICGKKFIFKEKAEILIDACKRLRDRYGKRTVENYKGFDGKSLSHALRVINEMIQLLTMHTISFPVAGVDVIKKVKFGEISKEEAMNIIDYNYEQMMQLIEESDLPEKTDITDLIDCVTQLYM